MVAIVSLVVGLLLARYVASLRTVIAVQGALYVVASTVLVITAPDHGSSHGTGFALSGALAPVTALVVVLGRIWRNHTTHAIASSA